MGPGEIKCKAHKLAYSLVYVNEFHHQHKENSRAALPTSIWESLAIVPYLWHLLSGQGRLGQHLCSYNKPSDADMTRSHVIASDNSHSFGCQHAYSELGGHQETQGNFIAPQRKQPHAVLASNKKATLPTLRLLFWVRELFLHFMNVSVLFQTGMVWIFPSHKASHLYSCREKLKNLCS